MSYPDLPAAVKATLANEMVRAHHHLWHFVRSRQDWVALSDSDREALEAAGWQAPRFEDESGSGLDFLGMHRQMIAMANNALHSASDSNWPHVAGWNSIPWLDEDDDWPVPVWQDEPPSWASDELWQQFTQFAQNARSPDRVTQMRTIAGQLRERAFLTPMTLDELGQTIEWTIHGWMHMRWSGAPHPEGFSADPANDWLFVPWSSHVNKHFWKLHGWIDERIGDWETATSQTADFSDAWAGPEAGVQHNMSHAADTRLLDHIPRREVRPLPMRVKNHVVEGLLARVGGTAQ